MLKENRKYYNSSMDRQLQSIIHLVSFLVFAISLCIFTLLTNTSFKKAGLIHWQESTNHFKEIAVKKNAEMPSALLGTVDHDARNYDKAGGELFFMCKSNLCEAKYSFNNLVSVNKISIIFSGEYPKDKNNLLFLAVDSQPVSLTDIASRCDAGSNICTYYFTGKTTIKNIDIMLRNGTYNPYGISEIKFYSATSKNFIDTLFDFIFIWPRSIFSYFFYPLIFFFIFITPGLLIWHYLKKRYPVHFAFRILISLLAFYLVLLITSLFFPTYVLKIIVGSAVLISLLSFFLKRHIFLRLFNQNKTILVIYITSLFFITSIMYIKDFPNREQTIKINDFYYTADHHIVVPFGTYETDFIIPFQSAINYMKGGSALYEKIGTIYNITDRTPLISLLLIPFLKLFGTNMFIYQMFTVTTGNLFIIAFYYVARNYVDNVKSAAIALVLSFSHFFVFVTLYWPQKTIALFFIFSSLYYLVKHKPDRLLAGIHMLIAFLLHMFVVVYYIPFSFFVLTKEYSVSHSLKKAIKPFLIYLIPTIIGFAIWTFFSFSIGQNQGIIWHIITERSWSKSAESIDKSSGIAPLTLSKITLDKQFWQDKFFNFTDLFVYRNHINRPTRIFNFYKSTIPGALGLIATLSFLLATIKLVFFDRKSLKKYLVNSFYFIVFPTFLTIMLHGFYIRTGVISYLLGIMPLLLLFVSKLFKTKYFVIMSLLFIGENLYLYFIQDNLVNTRLSLFTQSVPQFFFWIVIEIISVSIIILTLSYQQNHSD